jgi:hypothetical protein
MKNIEIVQKLIAGSQNIDRMREEVKQFTNMLIGLIHAVGRSGASKIKFDHEFKSDQCKWILKGMTGSFYTDDNKIEVECWEMIGESSAIMYCPFTNNINFHADNVQMVWENLHVLLEGVRKVLPEIEEKYASFVKAADVFA